MRVAEYNRPMLSDEVETAQTIALMDELADKDAAHRLVIEATYKALDEAGATLSSGPLDKATAVYWFLKRTIRYVPTPGTSPLVDQTLIPPASLLSMPDPEGDCPQFSMLASAMLRVCCVPCLYKTIAADPDFPDTYSHVYNVVGIGGGRFLPFDSSNGPEPGAEYNRRFKERIWPALKKSKCVPSIASGPSSVTKGNQMVRTSARPIAISNRNAVLRRGLKGTGHLFYPLQGTVCDEDGNCYDDGTGVLLTSPAATASLDPQYNMTGPNPTAGELAAAGYPLATAVATQTSPSSNPTSLAIALAQDATQLVAPIVKSSTQKAPYYVTNPATGQSVLFNPNTGATATPASFSAALSSISPTMLLFVGGSLLAMLAFSKK